MNGVLANILIQPKVVTPEGLKFLTDYIKNSPCEQMGVFDAERANKTGEDYPGRIDLSTRNVKCADAGPILSEVKELLDNIVHNIINPFYGFKVKDSELPQLLKYEPGGHYKTHVDAVAQWKNPDGSVIWKKSVDRDLSTVLFLNDDFEGGEFVFPDLRVRIKPEPGLLICFPSSQFYSHKVEPVISGTRCTLVTWMTVQGFKTKKEIDEELEKKYGIKVN